VNPYLVDRLPGDRAYSWVLACDPNKRHGGVLVAVDHLENWFVVAEHYRENIPDSKHAEAYQAMLRGLKLEPNRDVSIWADPGGAGAQAIINMAEVGLYAQPVPKDAGSVKASIERIRRQAWIDPGHHHPITGVRGAPRLYFLTSLRSEWELDGVRYAESRLMWELRQYRQKPNGASTRSGMWRWFGPRRRHPRTGGSRWNGGGWTISAGKQARNTTSPWLGP